MPADFDRCVKNGGKVITKVPEPGKFIHICFDSSGNSYAGEVKTKKTKKGKKK